MHEGHRGRLVGKIKSGGQLYEHELIEVLLFNACPRKDLNAVAHSLLDRFGSVYGVLSADVSQLLQVPNVGENMALYISCLFKTLAKCGDCKSFAVLGSTADFKKFLTARPAPQTDLLEICMLDKEGRVRRTATFPTDGGERIKPDVGKVVKVLSAHSPYGLFVSDRRAFGGCEPDGYEDEIAETLFEAAKLCGTRIFDFCVVSPAGEVFSYYVADRAAFARNRSGVGYGK